MGSVKGFHMGMNTNNHHAIWCGYICATSLVAPLFDLRCFLNINVNSGSMCVLLILRITTHHR